MYMYNIETHTRSGGCENECKRNRNCRTDKYTDGWSRKEAQLQTFQGRYKSLPAMEELDRRYVEEQLKALDEGGSQVNAISTNHQAHVDLLKSHSLPSPSSTSESSSRSCIPLKRFQPHGTVEFPLKFEDGRLLIQSNAVRTSLTCNVPGQVWNAKFSGSSLIRGPMGAATGSMLLSYDVLPRKLQAVSQVAVGDQANVMFGAIHNTSTAWYGLGIFCYPNKFGKKPSYAFQVQSQQRLENVNMTVKFLIPYHTMKPNTMLSVSNKTFHAELGMAKSRPQATLIVSPKLSEHRILELSYRWQKAEIRVDAVIIQSLGTAKSKIGMGVRHDSRQGVSWFFTWVRGDIIIKIPILVLNNESMMWYICSFYFAAVSFLIQECIADLWQLNSGDSTPSPQQLINKRYKARADAEKEKFLMQRQANSRRIIEQEKSGLVITKAIYYIPLEDSWDVTTQLQFWTDKSSLDLPAISKQNLLGFYRIARDSLSDDDEADYWWQFWKPRQKQKFGSKLGRRFPGTPLLKVQYDYSGSSYEIEVKDHESLSLPNNMARMIR